MQQCDYLPNFQSPAQDSKFLEVRTLYYFSEKMLNNDSYWFYKVNYKEALSFSMHVWTPLRGKNLSFHAYLFLRW